MTWWRRDQARTGRQATAGASRSVVVVGALCAFALSLTSVPASAAVQTATSSEGRFAWGDGEAKLSEDSRLVYSAYFARAEGVKGGTPTLGQPDLGQAFGSFALSQVTRVPVGPGEYPRTETTALCNSVENVRSYDVGRRTTMDMGSTWGGVKPVWTGLWFDVDCGGAFGYDFFRVHLDAGPHELLEAAAVDTENPVTTDWDATYGVSEEGAQKVVYYDTADFWFHALTGFRHHLPEIEPVSAPEAHFNWKSDAEWMQDLVTVSTFWNAGAGYDPALAGKVGWFGYTTGYPTQRQFAMITLCGHREGEEPHCYGRGPGGDIFPSVLGMTQTLHSPDAK